MKEVSEEGGSATLVRKQFPPFYNVVSGGVTIEWTDKLSVAQSAYKDAIRPKVIWRIHGDDIQCVNRMS